MKLRQLCDDLGIRYNEKNPKLSLNAIKKKYLVEQNGNKKDYTIVRPLTEEEIISSTKLVPYKNQFHVVDNEKDKSGVYKIELKETKQIYIGQTNNFYKRFCRHCNPSTYSLAKDIIKQGAIFSIIELENDEHERFIKESYWSQYYKNCGYELLNKEEVLFKNTKKIKSKKNNKLIYILKKYNIDEDLIDKIVKEYYSKEGK